MLLSYPRDQGLDVELVRTNPIQRRDDPPKHMVNPIELLGTFDGDHFPETLHYTNELLLSHGVGTDRANIRIRHIMTALAEFDLVSHPDQGLPKPLHMARIRP